MKYVDNGFRPLYKNFCIYPLNDKLKDLLKDQNGVDEAEGVMVYGYVDHIAGNILELLAFTKNIDGEKYTFLQFDKNIRCFVRVSELLDEEFTFVDYGNSHLYEMFKDKLKMLDEYEKDEQLVKSRSFPFLDEFRYAENFDDVKVILYRDDFKLEGVWVKIEELGKGIFKGTLLNDPKQDFGVKTGDPIAFIVNESEDKSKQLVADLTPSRKLKARELADGKLLKEALIAFNGNKNQFKHYAVLELLRDSKVEVPYTKQGPDLLYADYKYYFPVFSNISEMKKYGKNIFKTNMPFTDVLKKAEMYSEKIEGIVVNPFTESFLIPKSMFKVIENIVSRIEE